SNLPTHPRERTEETPGMAEGSRLRGSAPGSQSGEGQGDKEGSGGGGEKQEEGEHGVSLKKEIGLVSACGIIVGEYLAPQ
ncbi:hypothetical protein scyTo_0025247, partial [Scyliorhinus torazame]|nr:hypothetical protein [Scyliorhinus torazame]